MGSSRYQINPMAMMLMMKEVNNKSGNRKILNFAMVDSISATAAQNRRHFPINKHQGSDDFPCIE